MLDVVSLDFIVDLSLVLLGFIGSLYAKDLRSGIDSFLLSRRNTKRDRRIDALTKRIELIVALEANASKFIGYVLPPIVISLLLLGMILAMVLAILLGTFPSKELSGLYAFIMFLLSIFLAKHALDLCNDVAHAEHALKRLNRELESLVSHNKA